MRHITPLRYPGGKGKLYSFFSRLIACNSLENSTYVEPYAGGAGLALLLLMKNDVKHIYINDINKSIYSFWYSVLNHTEYLIKMIHDTKITVEEWKRQKSIQQNKESEDLLSLGFSTFFLNRVNRSGILHGGIIGGIEQMGAWKLDARFNKKSLVERIARIGEARGNISIFCEDACDFISRIDKTSGKFFYYLDPPYVKKGDRLYENFYKERDHQKVFKTVNKLKSCWVISYDDHEFINKTYNKHTSITYNLSYSLQQKIHGAEFMAFAKKLKLPEELNNGVDINNMFDIKIKVA